MDAISSSEEDVSEFGFIIFSCKAILHCKQTFTVFFAKRQADKVVDTLAKVTCSYATQLLRFLLLIFEVLYFWMM